MIKEVDIDICTNDDHKITVVIEKFESYFLEPIHGEGWEFISAYLTEDSNKRNFLIGLKDKKAYEKIIEAVNDKLYK